jgi:urease accessory protein UreF
MNKKLFWKRSTILYKAWQQAKHQDMKNIWKWKLIELMKIMPDKKYGLE